MNDQSLRALQAPLKERYRSDPASALATLSVKGQLERERIACILENGRPSVTTSGLHPMAGGDGSMTCSAEMLLEALAGCAGVTLCAVATAMNIPFERGTIAVTGDLDFCGTLGIRRDVPVGFQQVRINIELDTAIDEATAAKLAQLTERYCVVAQSLNSAAKPTIHVRGQTAVMG